jgi:hypothetical protein
MARVGVVPALIKRLNDDENAIKRTAAMCITNLSTDPMCQMWIAKQGGIQLLINLMEQNDQETMRYAGMALANLSVNRQNRQALVDLGGLRSLVKMAYLGIYIYINMYKNTYI